ncbi:hypothetical protein Pyrde_1759 [Pyrodictium delaneyi]|uniref:Uncharacterized protein n=1 Tax=Pyrodictium delaneyi TaxID=1273541 RepID=A0A0P0N4Y7_9CREN|nr:hypothetical protein Pyrde_1759 [Pyrodictium delaneyi]OWJ54982.1 hypothetical protein Pdsh_04620 [Pyrodictium delaneyi]
MLAVLFLLAIAPMHALGGSNDANIKILVDGNGIVWFNASIAGNITSNGGVVYALEKVDVKGNTSGEHADYVVVTSAEVVEEVKGLAGTAVNTSIALSQQGRTGNVSISIEAAALSISINATFSESNAGYYRLTGLFNASYVAADSSQAQQLAEKIQQFLNPVMASAMLRGMGLQMVRVDDLRAGVEIIDNRTLVISGSFTAVFDAKEYREVTISNLVRLRVIDPAEADRIRQTLEQLDILAKDVDQNQKVGIETVVHGSRIVVNATGWLRLQGPRSNVERILAYSVFSGLAGVASLQGFQAGAATGAATILLGAKLVEKGVALTVNGEGEITLIQDNGTVAYTASGLGIYKPDVPPLESAVEALQALVEVFKSLPVEVGKASIVLESFIPVRGPDNAEKLERGDATIYIVKLESIDQLERLELGEETETTTAPVIEATTTAATTSATEATITTTTITTSPITKATTTGAMETTTQSTTAMTETHRETTETQHVATTTSTNMETMTASATTTEKQTTTTTAKSLETTTQTISGISPSTLTASFAAITLLLIAAGYLAYRRIQG